jgi:uncharacterized membrane protein (UPF0127 family)
MEQGIVFVGDNIFETFIAITAEEQMLGLMYVDPPLLSPMSFIYEKPQINKFWMKNTKMPLDIIFCNGGIVSEICYGEPYSLRTIGSDTPSDLVIELPYGSVEQFVIKIAQSVELVKPPTEELRKIIAAKYYIPLKF